jgi:tetratricopeptide (TPR) repeat protein
MMKYKELALLIVFTIPCICYGQTVKDYNSRGIAKAKNQDYTGAIEEYNKALQIDSNSAIVLYNSGIAKAKLQEYRAAISDYTKSINLSPDADTYFNRGLSYFKLSEYSEAILDFNKALSLNPKINPQIYFERGSANFKLGKFHEAIQDFTESIELDPGNAKAFFNRGIAEYNLKMQSEGCSDLKKARDLGYEAADDYISKVCK